MEQTSPGGSPGLAAALRPICSVTLSKPVPSLEPWFPHRCPRAALPTRGTHGRGPCKGVGGGRGRWGERGRLGGRESRKVCSGEATSRSGSSGQRSRPDPDSGLGEGEAEPRACSCGVCSRPGGGSRSPWLWFPFPRVRAPEEATRQVRLAEGQPRAQGGQAGPGQWRVWPAWGAGSPHRGVGGLGAPGHPEAQPPLPRPPAARL